MSPTLLRPAYAMPGTIRDHRLDADWLHCEIKYKKPHSWRQMLSQYAHSSRRARYHPTRCLVLTNDLLPVLTSLRILRSTDRQHASHHPMGRLQADSGDGGDGERGGREAERREGDEGGGGSARGAGGEGARGRAEVRKAEEGAGGARGGGARAEGGDGGARGAGGGAATCAARDTCYVTVLGNLGTKGGYVGRDARY
eukprot:3766152-Rhodomonas_salina.1